MKLEQQVCSLELAKRLKELGVKQESEFFWTERGLIRAYPSRMRRAEMEGDLMPYSAFTVAELGEMLPKNAFTMSGANPIHPWNRKHQEYVAGFWPTTVSAEEIEEPIKAKKEPTMWYADTEADARAKMLVYLLENKLITI